jgi:hypothetical protein
MLWSVGSVHDKSRWQAAGMMHGTNHFFFSPRQPLHSINCSILGHWQLILSSAIGVLTLFKGRQTGLLRR